MIADGLHSVSDIVSTTVVLIGIKIAKKPYDSEHPYGHGKIEPITAGFVGITLVFAAFMIIKNIIEAIISHSFATPTFIALIAAVLSVIIKEIMYRVTYGAGKRINSQSIIADAMHHRSDALSSVGTFFGILGSMAGKQFNIRFLEYLDPLAGVAVACMIFKIAYDILKPSLKGLMDTSPDKEKINQIRDSVSKADGIVSVSWIRARYTGQHLYVDIEIKVNQSITVKEGHDIADSAKKHIKQNVSDVCDVLVHIEPCTSKLAVINE